VIFQNKKCTTKTEFKKKIYLMSAIFLNQPVDISEDFHDLENEYFIPALISKFEIGKGNGSVEWHLHRYEFDWYFNKIDKHLQLQNDKGAPFQDYDTHPKCDFSISFVSPKTVRLQMKTTTAAQREQPSLMLAGELPEDNSWSANETENEIIYESESGKLILDKKSFSIQLDDANNKKLLNTMGAAELKAMHSKAMPFCFLKRSTDYSRSIAASFSLSPGEKIYGCGESFTSLNKNGQKVVLFCTDAQSAASEQMYKPIPFFFSNRGYGMFVHTSSPVTMDFGKTHQGSSTIFIGEDVLDIFFFIGSPAEILSEYTAITGRSPLPPLWSFGLWMSRFSYQSEKQVLDVAHQLREHKFPCNVIHIDAGWFEKGINCDFQFAKETFPNPEKMIKDLKEDGFRTSIWQIPYFTPLNPLFDEVVAKQLYVKNYKGDIPTEDAILDFSNPEAVAWYRDKIKALFEKGISVIKADFGEAAPYNGYYHSGRSGYLEHNLYPLRYNKTVSEITKESTSENIIWARSAWAGSQRYPLHWGGDAEVSDAGMAGTLRGGLSLGLSGFSFWSHDIGGFSGSPKEELFQRWAFFGLLSSHSRVHGFPPREPWEFSIPFQESFRKITELRYKLMPYIYAQAALCSQQGLPMLKALFLNYPNDETAWCVEDQYLFGNDLLVAPLMEENITKRAVYLPEGKWIDYQTKNIYVGGQWQTIEANKLPGILLVRSGSILPQIELVQSTAMMDWSRITLVIFSEENVEASGIFYKDGMKDPQEIKATYNQNEWSLSSQFIEGTIFKLISFKEL
jgi:alpha-D-xyloside xylohydrolase